MTSTVKQTAGLLKGKAKKGQLPFDEALIDKPETVCVTFGGTVIGAGDCYEHKLSDGRTSLARITDVNPGMRIFKYEDIIATIPQNLLERAPGNDHWGWFTVESLARLLKNGRTKVSYSEKELARKKMLSQTYEYLDLINGKISKDMFLEYGNEIKWDGYGSGYLLRAADGKLVASSIRGAGEGATIVYPEPANEDFKKEVCETYLAGKKEAAFDDYSWKGMMKNLFGWGWNEIAQEYGKKATEKEIAEVCAKTWDDYIKNESGYGTDDKMLDKAARASSFYVVKACLNNAIGAASNQANALGDNKSEIDRMVSDYFIGLQEKFKAKTAARQVEMEKEAEEKLKSDPRYKAIPAEVKEAFDKIGITVKTNLTGMALPGFKGRRGAVIEPFAKWFFQDAGKVGTLYRVKDILKARYGAQFFSDAGEAFRGAWWHVSSTNDLKAIYELIA